LRPFLGSLIWAAAIVIATWPVLLKVQAQVGGRRSVATAVMVAIISIVFIIPLWIAIAALLDASGNAIEILRSYLAKGLGPPPGWLQDIPLVGKRIAAGWSTLAASGPEGFAAALRPYTRTGAAWMAAITGGIGGLVLHFILTVILVGVLYSQGEKAVKGLVAFARRLGQESGAEAVMLAGQSVRSVALGVVVTAVLQTILAGLGLVVSGVPHPGLLTAVAFVLCIAQLGPTLVLIPVVIWLFGTGDLLWATLLLIWSVPVCIMDNFLRPILISRGVDLPLLLIFGGVIGGLIGFGVIGVFVGPVILAVSYTLLQRWTRERTLLRAA